MDCFHINALHLIKCARFQDILPGESYTTQLHRVQALREAEQLYWLKAVSSIVSLFATSAPPSLGSAAFQKTVYTKFKRRTTRMQDSVLDMDAMDLVIIGAGMWLRSVNQQAILLLKMGFNHARMQLVTHELHTYS